MKFKIKKVAIFFIGLIILIVGIFIMIFDHFQLLYLENLDEESYPLLDEKTKIFKRLKIE